MGLLDELDAALGVAPSSSIDSSGGSLLDQFDAFLGTSKAVTDEDEREKRLKRFRQMQQTGDLGQTIGKQAQPGNPGLTVGEEIAPDVLAMQQAYFPTAVGAMTAYGAARLKLPLPVAVPAVAGAAALTAKAQDLIQTGILGEERGADIRTAMAEHAEEHPYRSIAEQAAPQLLFQTPGAAVNLAGRALAGAIGSGMETGIQAFSRPDAPQLSDLITKSPDEIRAMNEGRKLDVKRILAQGLVNAAIAGKPTVLGEVRGSIFSRGPKGVKRAPAASGNAILDDAVDVAPLIEPDVTPADLSAMFDWVAPKVASEPKPVNPAIDGPDSPYGSMFAKPDAAPPLPEGPFLVEPDAPPPVEPAKPDLAALKAERTVVNPKTGKPETFVAKGESESWDSTSSYRVREETWEDGAVVRLEEHPDHVQIGMVESRGAKKKGLGAGAYEFMGQRSREMGKPFWSSEQLSPWARDVWKSLEAKGLARQFKDAQGQRRWEYVPAETGESVARLRAEQDAINKEMAARSKEKAKRGGVGTYEDMAFEQQAMARMVDIENKLAQAAEGAKELAAEPAAQKAAPEMAPRPEDVAREAGAIPEFKPWLEEQGVAWPPKQAEVPALRKQYEDMISARLTQKPKDEGGFISMDFAKTMLNAIRKPSGQPSARGVMADPAEARHVKVTPEVRLAIRNALNDYPVPLNHPDQEGLADAMSRIIRASKSLSGIRNVADAFKAVEKRIGTKGANWVFRRAGLMDATTNVGIDPATGLPAEQSPFAQELRTVLSQAGRKRTAKNRAIGELRKQQLAKLNSAEAEAVKAGMSEDEIAVAMRGALRGAAEPIDGGFVKPSQEAYDWAMRRLRTAKNISKFDNNRLQIAWKDMFDKGEIPQPAQLELMRQVLGDSIVDEIVANKSWWQRFGPHASKGVNTLREFLTFGDLPPMLRQGRALASRHPIEASKAWFKGIRAALSEAKSEELTEAIRARPLGRLGVYDEIGFHFASDPHGPQSAKEDFAMRSWLQELPTLAGGGLFRTTARWNNNFLTLLRANVLDMQAEQLMKSRGIASPEQLTAVEIGALKEFNRAIESFSGRGSWGENAEELVPALNRLFFSQRHLKARLDMIGWTATNFQTFKTPEVRAYGRQVMAAYIASYAAFLAAAEIGRRMYKARGGEKNVEVGWNPLHTRAGQITVGNKRFAVGGGVNNVFRDLWRLYEGAEQLDTGAIRSDASRELPGGKTRWDLFVKAIRSKASPMVGLGIDLAKREDIRGNPTDIKSVKGIIDIAKRFHPLFPFDAKEAMADFDWTTPPMLAMAAVGADLQTYRQPLVENEYNLRLALSMRDQEAQERVLAQMEQDVQDRLITPGQFADIKRRAAVDTYTAAAEQLALDDLVANRPRVIPGYEKLADALIEWKRMSHQFRELSSMGGKQGRDLPPNKRQDYMRLKAQLKIQKARVDLERRAIAYGQPETYTAKPYQENPAIIDKLLSMAGAAQ